MIVNDVPLGDRATSIAQAFATGGYDTAYIGKWHVDGQGRSNYIPPERRQGFDYWKVLECTHDYNNSFYYAGDSDEKLRWEGYDAIEQTRDAQAYLRDRSGEDPFLMVLSWGPPHDPYQTAPQAYRDLYDPAALQLRPNVPSTFSDTARDWLAGYYAHCTALDACAGDLLQTLDEEGLADDTIFVFFSDHGDMVGSHGMNNSRSRGTNQCACPAAARPAAFGRAGAGWTPIDIPDIMPSRLWDCADLEVPETVQGHGTFLQLYARRRGSSPAGWLSCSARIHSVSGARCGRPFISRVLQGGALHMRALGPEGPCLRQRG